MKIKLRDMTIEQFEKRQEKNCDNCSNCLFKNVNCNTGGGGKCWVDIKDLYSDKFLDLEIEIEDEPLLTEKEKEYLRAVIKPFRDKVAFISKQETPTKTKEYICMFLNPKEGTSWEDLFALPYFEVETMYKGMELGKKYTLEELGL